MSVNWSKLTKTFPRSSCQRTSGIKIVILFKCWSSPWNDYAFVISTSRSVAATPSIQSPIFIYVTAPRCGGSTGSQMSRPRWGQRWSASVQWRYSLLNFNTSKPFFLLSLIFRAWKTPSAWWWIIDISRKRLKKTIGNTRRRKISISRMTFWKS